MELGCNQADAAMLFLNVLMSFRRKPESRFSPDVILITESLTWTPAFAGVTSLDLLRISSKIAFGVQRGYFHLWWCHATGVA
jgi:hypothetical protein